MLFLGEEHIEFQKITFDQAKELAKKENKLIFLSCFTSWCASCKWMESNVYTHPEVANYFNTTFINTRYDCEIDEGLAIAKIYQISNFPTYLFLDATGVLIYRTQSRIEVDLFLREAQQANDPKYQIPNLRKQFADGFRKFNFLLRYIKVMAQVDDNEVDSAKNALDSIVTDEFLRTPNGWETIKIMARSMVDRYGQFFEANKLYFKSIAIPVDFDRKEIQLLRNAIYDYIREKNETKFKSGLAYFERSEDPRRKIEASIYQLEWIAAHGTATEFVVLTNHLRGGLLKEEDELLSFIASRNANTESDIVEPVILKQCYVLAKQAVVCNESSYSNQGTLADICIALKKKKEAIKAAKAARGLAQLENSKIIELADALVIRAETL